MFDAKITGLYILPLYPKVPQKTFSKIEVYLLKEADKFLQKAMKIYEKHKVQFYDLIKYGDEGPIIISYAFDNYFDYVVVGKRGSTLIKESLLGSVSNYVVHKSPMPVLIVH
jgi:nucleotide-binding universal stress UspA family protein